MFEPRESYTLESLHTIDEQGMDSLEEMGQTGTLATAHIVKANYEVGAQQLWGRTAAAGWSVALLSSIHRDELIHLPCPSGSIAHHLPIECQLPTKTAVQQCMCIDGVQAHCQHIHKRNIVLAAVWILGAAVLDYPAAAATVCCLGGSIVAADVVDSSVMLPSRSSSSGSKQQRLIMLRQQGGQHNSNLGCTMPSLQVSG
jgi:hypothetical protein